MSHSRSSRDGSREEAGESGTEKTPDDAKPDSTFLAQFESLIVEEWRVHYFPYRATVNLLNSLYDSKAGEGKSDEHTPLLAGSEATDRPEHRSGSRPSLINPAQEDLLQQYYLDGFLESPTMDEGIVTLSDVQLLEKKLLVIDQIHAGVQEMNEFFELMLKRLHADYEALQTQLESVAISTEMHSSSSSRLLATVLSRNGSPSGRTSPSMTTTTTTTANDQTAGDSTDAESTTSDHKYLSFGSSHRPPSTSSRSLYSKVLSRARSTAGDSPLKTSRKKSKNKHLSSHYLSLARVFVQLYRQEVMLLNFITLNYRAVDDVLKRLDSFTADEAHGIQLCRPRVIRQYLTQQPFVVNERALNDLVDNTVQTFATHFENGNVENAKARLLQKLTSSEYTNVEYMRLGIKVGLCLGLLMVAVVGVAELRSINVGATTPSATKEKTMSLGFYASGYLPVYRGIGFLVVLCWLWGLSVYIWSKFRINYVFIFRFDPRNRLGYQRIWEESCELTIVYLINFLLFLGHVGLDLEEQLPSVYKVIGRRVYPLTLFAYILVKLVAPWDSTRSCLWSALKNIVIAPFGMVYFVHSYIADVLTSMVKPLVDLSYVMCFYLSGVWVRGVVPTRVNQCTEVRWLMVPIVSALPFWFRFGQCMHKYFHTGDRWPHLGNAAKYACAHTVIVMGSFHPLFGEAWAYDGWDWTRILWFVSVCITTLYTFVWDITMDWGLIRYEGGHWVRRTDLLYHRKRWYAVAIAANFVLRSSWTITLTPFDWDSEFETLLIPLLGVGELCRRTLWGCFRVEWEHLQTAKDRAGERVPVFFDNRREMKQRRGNVKDRGWAVVFEVVMMVVTLIGLAFLSARL